MSYFIKKMKSAAEQAKVKDHPLFTREYGLEIRNAYFFGAAASLCFLDDELDAEEQKALKLLGLGLHLSAEEIDDVCKSVQKIGDDDKMPFLQEVFALMDSDYLKYALLTDMHTLCLKKGNLTENEKDFINTATEILFRKGKDVFSMWEAGLTLDNIDQAETFSPDAKKTDDTGAVSVHRDPFFEQMAENNRTMYDALLKLLNDNPEFKDKLKEESIFEEKMLMSFFIDYKVFREQMIQAGNIDENMPVYSSMPAVKEALQQDLFSKGVTAEDIDKIHSMADVCEIMLQDMLVNCSKAVNEWLSEKRQRELENLKRKLENYKRKLENYKRNALLMHFSGILDNNVYIAPNIPQSKLDGARRSYVPNYIDKDDILVLVDDTAFGGAGDGFVITHDAVYSHEIFMDPVTVYFHKFSEIKYNKNEIYIDGKKACHVCLPSAKAMEELACGIAGICEYSE